MSRTRIEKQRQMSLFERASEKGSREWAAFNSVRSDRADMYRVARPRVVHVPVHSFHPQNLRFTVPILRHAH